MMSFRAASDQSLLIRFGAPAPKVPAVRLPSVPGIRNVHPAYESLLVVFDSLALDHEAVERIVRDLMAEESALPDAAPRVVEIPVSYGGENGPDLEDVAAISGLSAAEVIELHSATIYTVSFLGFVPGFAYLSGLPDRLAAPRLKSPRTRVPAGSVAIGGKQTAVYPMTTPGGWRLIGRTTLQLFDPAREKMSLLEIGDQVRFRPL